MNHNIQEPTLVDRSPMGDRYTHPAFATISAHRIQGHAELFGSNVGHDGFVQIEVNQGHLSKDGYSDHISGGGKSFLRLWMSEAQWVAFVSRMNMGSGTPCTLRHAPTGPLEFMPGLPPQEMANEKLGSRVDAIAAANLKRVEEASAEIHELVANLPVRKREAILDALGRATNHLKANHEYAKKVLTTHKETLVAEAKVEIEAMVSGICTQLGIDSLQQLAQAAKLPALPPAGDA